jgi:hypothetical protein
MTPLAKTAQIRAGLEAAEQDGRGLLRGDVAGQLEGNLARSRSVAAEGAADGIENGALGDPYDVFGKILVFSFGRIAGQGFAERRLTLSGLRHGRKGRRTRRQTGGGDLLQEMPALNGGHRD